MVGISKLHPDYLKFNLIGENVMKSFWNTFKFIAENVLAVILFVFSIILAMLKGMDK
jgi:hypothetical protein